MKTPIEELRVRAITDLVEAFGGLEKGHSWTTDQRRAYNRAIRHAKKRTPTVYRDEGRFCV